MTRREVAGFKKDERLPADHSLTAHVECDIEEGFPEAIYSGGIPKSGRKGFWEKHKNPNASLIPELRHGTGYPKAKAEKKAKEEAA